MESTSDIKQWIEHAKDNIDNFIESTVHLENRSKLSLSKTGDVLPPNQKWGLAQATFLVRISTILNREDLLFGSTMADFIQSFRKGGFYYDLDLHKNYFGKRSLIKTFFTGKISDWRRDVIISESRQAVAALINASVPIPYAVSKFHSKYWKKNSDSKYFEINSDTKNPWRYSSQINHMVFFHNHLNLDSKDTVNNGFIRWVKKNTNSNDGTFSAVDAPENQKIGSTMKILMALNIVGKKEYGISRKLVDFILQSNAKNDACELFNTVYILNNCRSLDYRMDEIIEYAINKANLWRAYYKPNDGAFSFNEGKSTIKYYKFDVAAGKNEADYHGTAMFYWGFLMLSEILNINKTLQLRTPVL